MKYTSKRLFQARNEQCQTEHPRTATRTQLEFLSAKASSSPNSQVGARVFEVVLVAPLQNGLRFSPKVLGASAALFNGATVFCDHNALDSYAQEWKSTPSIRNVVGVLSDAQEVDGSLRGNLHVSPSALWLAGLLDFAIELREQGLVPPDVGMSADISFSMDDGVGTNSNVREIYKVWSVDVVFNPAAGGETILRALNSSALYSGVQVNSPKHSLETISRSGTNATEGNMLVSNFETKNFWRQTFAFDANSGGAGGETFVSAPVGGKDVGQTTDGKTAFAADAQKRSDELLRMQCAQTLSSVLGGLALPEVHKAVIRERFENKVFSVAELNQAIEGQKKIHAAYVEKQAIGGIEQAVTTNGKAFVNGMWTDLDRLQFAADRLLGAAIPENMSDLPRLNGIRELYLLLSGDYNFRGQFDASRVQFINATTSTMAGLVAVALNKVVATKWAELQAHYGWFHKIVHEEDFDSLNTINWITVGGFGDFPTVSEGAAYTEMVWDDNTEQASWLKKGGYIGLTLEMMDRDETRKVKQIPIAMATAGMRTLSAAVANIFKQASGAGPNLADGTALFHTNSALRGGDGSTAASGNLSTTALSAAEWDVHVQKTFAKAELNSGRRLGLRPRYLVVPIELEKTALIIFTTSVEPSSNVFYENVRASSAENVVVCPEMTDATDWLSVVDPKVYPCIGVGYRYGRKPEIFTAGEETIGSMFTNDELRVKGRFFYGVGVIDWRGLRKANVAG